MGRKRRILPVFGGLTAAATATGAVPLAHAAVAAPAPEAPTDDSGTLGAAQDGTFEPCSAYFGFGKHDEEAPNLTGFEVVDASGDDEGGHAVPDDVQVVLVIETEGGTLECTPEPVTEEEWAHGMADWGWFQEVPDFPDHPVYAYPTTSPSFWIVLQPEGGVAPQGELPGFGEVQSVGFRVVGVPGDHELVSPTALQPLPDHFAAREGVGDPVPDPDVVALLEERVGPEAAAAWAEAVEACETVINGVGYIGDDPDLLAALNFLRELTGQSPVEEAYCWDVHQAEHDTLVGLGLQRGAAHVEVITLAGPTAPEQPVPPAPTPPAAQPVPAAPTFTG